MAPFSLKSSGLRSPAIPGVIGIAVPKSPTTGRSLQLPIDWTIIVLINLQKDIVYFEVSVDNAMAVDINCCFDQGGEKFPGISNRHIFNVAARSPFA